MTKNVIQQVSDTYSARRDAGDQGMRLTATALIEAIHQKDKDQLLQLQGVHAASGNLDIASLIKEINNQL